MENEITLNAVGDVWFGDHPVVIGHGVNSSLRHYGTEYVFEHVKPVLESGDINFCNLESVLSASGCNKWYLPSVEMRGFPQCVQILKFVNFNIVNIANNHTLQHGRKPFNETIELLEKNNISYIGLDCPGGGTNLVTREVNGVLIGFVGFSLHPEQYCMDSILYSYRRSGHALLKEVKQIREGFKGVLIVSLHWGVEFLHYPSFEQIQLAHELIESGVTLVLGHHPHVLQGVEEYRNGLIIYSLGNFLFDLWEEHTRQTVIASVKLNSTGIKDYSMVPCYIGERYQPTIAKGKMKQIITSNTETYTKRLKQESYFTNDEYKIMAQEAKQKFRYSSYKYFLRNIGKYPLHFIAQSLFRALFRKIQSVNR